MSTWSINESGCRFCRALALVIVVAVPLGVAAGAGQRTLSVDIPIGNYQITDTADGHSLALDGFGRRLIPGTPELPARIFAIAIPPGAELVGVTCETGPAVVLPGTYRIAPAPLPRVIGDENPDAHAADLARYEARYNAVYGSDAAYPAEVVEFVRAAGYRKYNLVDVRVTPFAYQPFSGQLTYYPDITVHVSYEYPETPTAPIEDNLIRTEQVAADIILNYEQAAGWSPPATPGDGEAHDFVVITLDSLTGAVAPLVSWEQQKGRSVKVVTTDWIDANYAGYDLAEKMRNFLREKYPSGQWGIRDVLLAGHYDDVPMRRTWQDISYGMPETDFYYAELSKPDNQSWDGDQDHRWGEESDPIDFYNEVNVGRIPWSEPDVVQHICEKSVAYEQNHDPSFKKNILLLGAFFWDNDPNPRTDNAVLMEAKVDQPWMSDWTMTRMYEQGHSTYAMDKDLKYANVITTWMDGTYAFVNWAGHGSPTSSHRYHDTGEAFISAGAASFLNDDYPAIIFADACSNSDTDHLNLGQAMLKRGGVGFVGATKVALGRPGWSGPNDGSSQSMDYFFTVGVTSGDYTQGEAHQAALREMYTRGLWNALKYETFEWGALWGNPDLTLELPPFVGIEFPDGVPESLPDGQLTEVNVRIVEYLDQLVPGSAKLHYRYDGGDFQTADLVSMGDGLFVATLPIPACDDTPEFYFSAEGQQCGVVYRPPAAPQSTFTATVGEVIRLLDCDFESGEGWTVTDSASLTDGTWDRGVPVNCNRGDPPADYDTSGQCFVTDNSSALGCNSDVDDGYTWLTSPTIDLSRGDAEVRYALWYTNNYGFTQHDDVLVVWVSNDDGATWVAAETVGPVAYPGWSEHSFRVADFVTPTATVRIRFEASDLNDPSVVEAAVDAFLASRFDCLETTLLGDLNCDGALNLGDVNPFVLAMTDLAAYRQSYPACPFGNRDLNQDGRFDMGDVNPFVKLLAGR